MDLKKKIEEIPAFPGVYFFKNELGEIIYIGKASQLKKRVSSYFAAPMLSPKNKSLVSLIRDIDYIVTGSAQEALLYEAHLIKKYKPKFNVVSRDDKAYPLLELTVGEEYPRLFITRRKKNNDALYFGPFTDAKALKQALALMRKIFPLRTCKKMAKEACLNYYLKQCLAPCVYKEKKDIYWKIAKDVILFLEGSRKELISRLSKRMAKYSEAREFEKAVVTRDQIKAHVSLTTPRREAKAALEKIKELLGLKDAPKRIDAFDISNYSGKEAVGSLVSFVDGEPKKVNYRRFKIKFVKRIDDYAMMREVIERAGRAMCEAKEKRPDILLIDGGYGHLRAVLRQLEESGILGINVAALAKEHEHLYVEGRQKPIELFKFPQALFLIQRIRDEAHRFAISYHHKLRSKSMRVSALDQIPGVGEKRKSILLRAFGSVNGIRGAKISELTKLAAIDEKIAGRIIEYLKG